MMAANKVCGNRWDAGAYICPFIHVQWSVLGPCAAAYMTNYIVPLSGGLMPKVVQYSAPIGPPLGYLGTLAVPDCTPFQPHHPINDEQY